MSKFERTLMFSLLFNILGHVDTNAVFAMLYFIIALAFMVTSAFALLAE